MSFKTLRCFLDLITSSRVLHTDVGQSGVEISPEDELNSSFAKVDALATKKVKDFSINNPPPTPNSGEMYIVGPSPTGVFSGHAGELAIYTGVTADYTYIPIFDGMILYDDAAGEFKWWSKEGSPDTWHKFIFDDVSPTTVTVLSQSISNPPTTAQIENIRLKTNELINALKDVNILP